MNSATKNYIKKGIILATALMALLTLCFTLLKFDFGYGEPIVESGFTMLSFESKFIDKSHWGGAILGVFSILELITAIACIGLALWNFSKTNKFTFINVAVIGGTLFNVVFYMIEGLIFKSMVLDSYSTAMEEYFTTACFVPLILVAVLVCGYIAVEKFIPVSSDVVVETKSEGKASKVNLDNELTTAESLKKYKELLDAGVITQEEFETKKKQILGL